MATKGRAKTRIDPGEPRDPYAGDAAAPPPKTVGEALSRARRHGQAAAAEALAMVRALIDAASLLASGRPSEANRLLGPAAKLLEGLSAELARDGGEGASQVLASIAAAIDDEIERWEDRARDDTEARTVLRAFLGLREILWELGVRRSDEGGVPGSAEGRKPAPRPKHRTAGRPGSPRVERVPVQG